ncbi:MAG TPA: aminoacyl-tRNA hydrolase [Thermohalobaculum sp.]|nr:aminoacyl-tRNA hydrolase [Thermohalobaculum sp.]
MQLFVGLGNPGAKYAHNRHNIGFMAIDAIAAANGFGPWRTKFQAAAAEGHLGSTKVLLIKPQTFMNLSGQAVGEAMRYLKLTPEDIWVFHDELDLAPGKLRVKKGGGHAGHNGLRSMHQHVGADYSRIRMGIGHPGHKDLVSHYVLHDFAQADREWLDPLLAAVGREAGRLVAGDAAGFMNAVALATRPAVSDTAPTKKEPGASVGNTVPEASAPAAPPDDVRQDGPLARLLAKFSRR